MQEVEIALEDEEASFIDDHDLQPAELLRKQLERERERIRQNNPEPDINKEATDAVTSLISAERNQFSQAFRRPIGNAPIDLSATTNGDGTITLKIMVRFSRLPSDVVVDTMSDNPFLNRVEENLNTHLEDEGVEPATFDLVEEENPDYPFNEHKAKYSATVEV